MNPGIDRSNDNLEILFVVLGSDFIQGGIHTRVDEIEPEHLGASASGKADDHAVAVRWVAGALDPTAAFEPTAP